MVANRCLCSIFFFLLAGFASSAPFLSNNIFDSHEYPSRSLLQAKKKCPIDFQSMNYTVLTSQCKGPQYPAKLCCDALKQFACPFADNLNDLSNDCAPTMFSYINLYGKYPPGLFANECKGDKEGLVCDDPVKSNTASAGGRVAAAQSAVLMMLSAGFLVLFVFLN